MGVFSNLRVGGSRIRTTHEEETSPFDNGVVIVTPLASKRRWSNLMPFLVFLVVVAEIAFLGRLNMAKNAYLVDSFFTDSLFHRSPPSFSGSSEGKVVSGGGGGGELLGFGVLGGDERNLESDNCCEEWLEREDSVVYSRDFEKDPILVSGAEKEWQTCAVGCRFGFNPSKKPDAAFGLSHEAGTASVLRSMESAQYYAENNIALARGRGYDIVMTTSLSSDVPVGYFSWAEYDIMAPVQPKTETALAAVFISNCGARNFRLQALEGLVKANIKIDSYGNCHRNRDGRVDKVETLKRYKFSLAFENSNEEDYVTENFFQSLVAGTVPVVVGPPNIQEFAPALGSILHIKELRDVESVAEAMKHLAGNPVAYNHSLRWKYEGPSDSFKALVDMAAVHSSCRLCIHLATKIQEKEESPDFKKRPCKCTRGSETVYHLYVRERGKFAMESIFLRSGSLTLEAIESAVLKKFKSLNYVPIWKQERPESIRGEGELKVYRIYPVGLTQRQALYNFKFNGDVHLRSHIESNPCAKFEVIFV
ncbi:LOW QUALITY PROTEIN: Glyco_transf_10 domain-containing protein [Cephalotus follicularis]|uniref:Fucosyltransferase n=1 Tax=Cephalotus follicularis TaxID=3775 RepID=A0A1Q3DII1_CEPFO|nr:LOW QUALITY PROTEIN: Glyco_transf_10 domain-containing protein [Cephalotus follicularis]GAV92205.1 LOW QUALITY PROTEIN: Glyco_transf_10 domain-containing protein [Cephalotus follicularis]